MQSLKTHKNWKGYNFEWEIDPDCMWFDESDDAARTSDIVVDTWSTR